MKPLTIIFQIFLSLLILTPKLFAQYDGGTIIHSETGTNLHTVLKNYQVVDFDGDNYVDIIMIKNDAVNNTNYLTWYKGNGNGNFSPQENLLTVNNDHKENEIFYADMNGDGNKDIVFQNSDTSFIILLNDGGGSITTQIANDILVDHLYEARLKEIADIDGDTNMDALFIGTTWNVSQNIYRQNCLLGYNNGNGNFSNYNYLNDDNTMVVTLIETADIDGDNDLDIIYSGSENLQSAGGFGPTLFVDAYVRIYENLNNNGFALNTNLAMPQVDNAEPAFTHIKAQNINSDGNDELLIEYAIWDICQDPVHAHGCTFHYQFHVLNYNTQQGGLNIVNQYNTWLQGYPLEDFYYSSQELYDAAFLIEFADQNNDNNLDILSVNVPQGKLHWYNGDGNGGFSNGQVVNFNSQYSNIRPALRAVDIDNDSDLDIFVLLNDDNSSTLTVFENLSLSPTCSPILDLAGSFVGNGIYQAGTTTLSNGHIIAGSIVTLKAGNRVTLESGFKIPQNSSVEVKIDPCDQNIQR